MRTTSRARIRQAGRGFDGQGDDDDQNEGKKPQGGRQRRALKSVSVLGIDVAVDGAVAVGVAI